jgi:hypothetical protein
LFGWKWIEDFRPIKARVGERVNVKAIWVVGKKPRTGR